MINSIYETYEKIPVTFTPFSGMGKKRKKKKGKGIVQQKVPQQTVIEEKEIKRGIIPWAKKKKTKKVVSPLLPPKMRRVSRKAVRRECPSSVLCRPLAGPLEPYMYFALGGLIGVFVLRMMK